MESPLKERLTGALIVVAVLVIVVPEMLSGPGRSAADSKPEADAGPPVRTYSLELGTPAAARTQDQSALTPQSSEPEASKRGGSESPERSEPASSEGGEPAAAESRSEAKPAVAAAPVVAAPPAPAVPAATAVAPPTVAPVAAPTPDVKPAAQASAPIAAKNAWWVQLGSFSARDNAERLARDLRGKGYSINVARIKVGAKDLYRVRAGPVANRDAAAALQSRLAAAGHKSSLVAP